METLNNLTLNFNLRQPKKQAATPIYCVVAIEGRQLKMPMGLKVNSWQWDKHKQLCTVTANMTESDRVNNMEINGKLNAVRCAYEQFFTYLCNGGTYTATDIENELRERINAITYTDMSNKNAIPPKRTKTATSLLLKAFEHKYEGAKERTYKAQYSCLNAFLNYIKSSKKGDTPQNFLTQKALNEYKEFLRSEGATGAEQINRKIMMVAMMVKELCGMAEFERYHLQPLNYEKVEDSRKKEDGKKRELTESELKAVYECETLTDAENEYRDLFIMQVETGVRVSDLRKLFKGQYTEDEIDGEKCYFVMTQKEEITAVIIVNETILKLQKRYKKGFNFIKIDSGNFTENLNRALKRIFKKAGLTKPETYYEDVNGKKVEKVVPLCDIISSHFARHTFITTKIRQGFSSEKLCYMTGHADDTMIKEIYSHINVKDKAKEAIKEFKRVKGKAETETKTTDNDAQIIAEQARQNYELKEENTALELQREKEGLIEALTKDLVKVEGGEMPQVLQITPSLKDSFADNLAVYDFIFGDTPTLDEYKAMRGQNVSLMDAYRKGLIKPKA